MQNQKIEFTFSSAEVNRRSIMINLEGQPATMALIKRHSAAIEEKVPYTSLLCQKIKDSVANKNNFRVWEGFKHVSGGFSRCYVKCSHGIKMPVNFITEDLKFDSELSFSVTVKCSQCISVPVDQPEQPAPQQQPLVPRDPVLPLLVLNVENEVTPEFKKALTGINEVVSRAYYESSLSIDPRSVMGERKNHFGDLIIKEWLDAFRDCNPEIPPPPPLVLDPPPPQVLDPPPPLVLDPLGVDPLQPLQALTPTPLLLPRVTRKGKRTFDEALSQGAAINKSKASKKALANASALKASKKTNKNK